jgi:hypothetical protein
VDFSLEATDMSTTGKRDSYFLYESFAAISFIVGAILLRSPALLYSVLNYDESMYLLMGAEFARGHMPYTTVCDLKPFGLFALATPFTMLPVDPVIAARIGSSVTVGLTGWMLSRIAALLFQDTGRPIGVIAGLCYLIFSLVDGGMAFQGEIFQNLFAVLALLLVLRPLSRNERPSLLLMAGVGLILGIAIQIKQSVLFDMLAFLAGYFILTTPSFRDFVPNLRSSLMPLILLGVMALVPTVAVILRYMVTGHWDAWFAANIEAHRVFYGIDRGFVWDAAFREMAEQTPLWIGAAAAILASRWLTIDGREKRAVLFLAVWIVAVILCQFFLRIASDHYFLQFLPPLSLATGLALGRGLLIHVPNRRPRVVMLAVLGGITVFAVAKHPLMHSIYIVRDRLAGDTWAGDTPRRIATDLKPMIKPDDKLYVVGFQPAVYFLTGAESPTRFSFTGMPTFIAPGRDGCPWIEPAIEMRRILDSRPRFIVIENGIFYKELREDVRRLLDENLETNYRKVKSYDQHFAHHLYPFERFVMNGGAPADLYERIDPGSEMSAVAEH